MAALPVVAAFVAYFFWTPRSGINYGELIEPLALPDAAFVAPDGRRFQLSELRGRWVLAHISSGPCTELCVKQLFIMRQVRLMQAKEMDRVERLWLLSADSLPSANLLQGYEGMRIGRGPAALVDSFPADDRPDGHIYLIDPLGNLMLRFPRDAEARSVAKDLARLLKVSHVG